MSPDEQFDKTQQEAENGKLQQMLKKYSDGEKKKLYEQGIFCICDTTLLSNPFVSLPAIGFFPNW